MAAKTVDANACSGGAPRHLPKASRAPKCGKYLSTEGQDNRVCSCWSKNPLGTDTQNFAQISAGNFAEGGFDTYDARDVNRYFVVKDKLPHKNHPPTKQPAKILCYVGTYSRWGKNRAAYKNSLLPSGSSLAGPAALSGFAALAGPAALSTWPALHADGGLTRLAPVAPETPPGLQRREESQGWEPHLGCDDHEPHDPEDQSPL